MALTWNSSRVLPNNPMDRSGGSTVSSLKLYLPPLRSSVALHFQCLRKSDNMSNSEESPYVPPNMKEDAAKPRISPGLFFIACTLLTCIISYSLTFVFPGEDRSLSYLPRFLPSIAIAGVSLKLLGLWPTTTIKKT